MPIIKTAYDFSTAARTVTNLFEGRVVRIEHTTETRNWSDTMDYTDMRSTECTWALVWLGTHGLPPRGYEDRPIVDLPAPWNDGKERDLEFYEQFAWIDCTNLFSDRCGYSLEAVSDGAFGQFGEPLMWANLFAWDAHQDAARAERLKKLTAEIAAREAEIAAENAKRAARRAKADAKAAASKTEADAQLALIPPKGTVVTVGNFTGTIFWMGSSKYRGKFSARAGVRASNGEVIWVDAAHWAK